MVMNKLSVEQRILIMMRKTLASIVKDTTPQPGMRHPLKENTIQNIRDCFELISAREQELSKPRTEKQPQAYPRFADQRHDNHIIPMTTLKKSQSSEKK